MPSPPFGHVGHPSLWVALQSQSDRYLSLLLSPFSFLFFHSLMASPSVDEVKVWLDVTSSLSSLLISPGMMMMAPPFTWGVHFTCN